MSKILSEVRKIYGVIPNYINGEFRPSASARLLKIYNPSLDEVIGEVPISIRDEVSEAVDTAYEAFNKWREIPITKRIQYLYRIKEVLERYSEDIARVITQNHGKTIHEARGDMRRTIDNVEAAISAAYTLAKGEYMQNIAEGIDEYMIREPLGVFIIVTPFNFPTMISFWFIPYAIVLGNTVVVKPSEITPAPFHYILELLHREAVLPKGVINVVHGDGSVVEDLVKNKKVVGVASVGSSQTAERIYRLAGEYGKRSLNGGGAKNFVVVMPDADLDRYMPTIISSFFGNAGQRCLAGSNLVLVGEIYSKGLRAFVESASKLKLGYGLDESVDMGPLVTSRARERVINYIEKGVEEGAKLILDGRGVRVREYPRGYFLAPTIFEGVTPDMVIAREEIFGPVASVIRVESLDEAIEMINKSEYGNAAAIFTRNLEAARKFVSSVEAGNIGVNIGIPAPIAFFPFAGRKRSFYGVLHPQIDTIDFFTDKKVVIVRP
jgi:malonate-semialdehyde dehydrogenase (acetylating)/methylmalonate-semialdehyde dehydrogenase